MTHCAPDRKSVPGRTTTAHVVEIKADALDESSGAIEGYGALFGERDKGGDIILPGAFAATIAAHKAAGGAPAFLYQHDPGRPIGVWDSLEEDDRGLRVTGRLILDAPDGKTACALLKAGAVKGLSIGYRTVKADREPKSSVRFLQEVELWEVSLVTFPMQARAGVDAVKFSELKAGVETLADAEEFLRDEGDFSRKAARDFIARVAGIVRAQCETADEMKATNAAAERLIATLST